jgi:hypothetical protein
MGKGRPQLPQKIITADFETRGFGGDFIIGGLYDGEEYKKYYTVEQFFDLLNEWSGGKYRNKYLVVYFHWFDFDARYILPQNAHHIDTLRTIFIDNLLAVLKFKKSLRSHFNKVEFRDSYKLFSESLEKACKSFDVPHKKMDKTTQFERIGIPCRQKRKYGLCNEGNKDECPYIQDCTEQYFMTVPANDEWFLEYLRMDCISLYELLERFQHEIDNIAEKPVRIGYTIASTAMRLFKAMDEGIYESICWQKKLEETENPLTGPLPVVRKSYSGGRCEVFKRIGSNLNSYDVNSLYPSVMALHKFPINPSPVLKDIPVKDFLKYYRGRPYIVTARVSAPKDLIVPILPLKMNVPGERDVKLLYPVGGENSDELEWTWCSPEFEKALRNGYKLLEVKELILYGAEVDLFSGYVYKLYDIKQHATGARRQVAKLLMNSLYGKFGQRDEVHRLKIVTAGLLKEMIAEKTEEGEPRYAFLQVMSLDEGNFLVEYRGESHMDHNYVTLSSFITSYARLALYEWMEVAWSLGGEVWYVDTDSVKTNVKMPNDPNKLGALKDEGHILEAVFIKPKVYATFKGYKDGEVQGEVKNKGVIKAALNKMDYYTMKAWLFQNEVVLYTYDEAHPEEAEHKRAPKVRDVMYRIHDKADKIPLKKKQKLVDDKRVLDKNLVDTYPLGYNGPRKDQLDRPIRGEAPLGPTSKTVRGTRKNLKSEA